MVEPINLNKARKARARVVDRAKAAQNRVTFGRPKTDTLAARLDADRARRDLDGKKRED
ncbi:MAG: DUF4169 family protein [Phenylobacterium sp.]|nr:DUF4169 family protein [Phenylobacterium sp.]